MKESIRIPINLHLRSIYLKALRGFQWLMLLLMMGPLSALAEILEGPISSGGGMSVICQEEEGSSRVQLLDYFEAVQIYGETNVEKASGDFVEDYIRLVNNIHRLQGLSVGNLDLDVRRPSQRNLDYFFRSVEWVHSSDLPFLDDSGQTVEIPSHCSIKQLAIWYDDSNDIYGGNIKIARDLWNQMDSMNQAALVQHELFYMENHDSEYNSMSARAYIQLMLTSEIHHEPVNLNHHKANLLCWNHDLSLYFYVFHQENSSIFQFTQFAGRTLLARTTAEVEITFDVKPGEEFGDIPVDPTAHFDKTVDVKTNRKDWQLKLYVHGGRPVTLQAMRNHRPISEKETVSCIHLAAYNRDL